MVRRWCSSSMGFVTNRHRANLQRHIVVTLPILPCYIAQAIKRFLMQFIRLNKVAHYGDH